MPFIGLEFPIAAELAICFAKLKLCLSIAFTRVAHQSNNPQHKDLPKVS
jgi:hypothetical protein